MRAFRKRGTILVLATVLIPFFLILSMFAISLGFLGVVSSQLDGVTDAVSRAGASAGAYAYENLENGKWVKHVLISPQPEPDYNVIGALPAAKAVWQANQKYWMAGIVSPKIQYNPPVEPGKSSNDQYGEGHFWATSTAEYQHVYLRNTFFPTPNVPIKSQSLTEAHAQ